MSDLAQLAVPRFRFGLPQHGPQRSPMAFSKWGAAGRLENRRKNVDILDERLGHRIYRNVSRPAKQQRDADGRLVKCALPQATVVAEHLSMVGEEDNKQVI